MPAYKPGTLSKGKYKNRNGARRNEKFETLDEYNERIATLILRDEKGRPILDEDGNTIPVGPQRRPDRIRFPEFLVEYNHTQGKQTPAFHLELAEWLHRTGPFGGSDERRRILQAYRFRAKRYIACVYVVWLLFQNPNFEIILSRAATNLATRNSLFIKQIIEGFDWCYHLLPQERRENWSRVNFTVERRRQSLNPSVTCMGIDTAITGQHRDIIIGDDVEGSRYADSEEWNEKIRTRVAEFSAICPRRHLFIGTPHRVDRLYVRLKASGQGFVELKRPVWKNEDTGETQIMDVPMGEDNEMQDAAWVAQHKAAMPPGMFDSQMLLIPSRLHKTAFRDQLLHDFEGEIEIVPPRYRRIKGMDRWRYFIRDEKAMQVEIVEFSSYYDPALGGKRRDNAVLRIVGRTANDRVYVFERLALPPVDARNNFRGQCVKIVKKLAEYHLDQVIVEENFSPSLANDLRTTARDLDRLLHVRRARRTSTLRKEGFIRQHLDPLVRRERLYLHKKNVREGRNFVNEFLDFPTGRHDDHIDRVAGAIRFLHLDRIGGGGRRDPMRLVRTNVGYQINKPRFQAGPR